jgi:hypothetical protein
VVAPADPEALARRRAARAERRRQAAEAAPAIPERPSIEGVPSGPPPAPSPAPVKTIKKRPADEDPDATLPPSTLE